MWRQISMNEYIVLRDELLKQYDIIQNSRYVLYVTVVSILSFSISKKEPLLFLIPYIVIIPTYLITIDYTIDTFRICTYLMVFHEGKEFKWENRQYKFNNINSKRLPKRENYFHSPFILSSVICTILFFAFIKYPSSIQEIYVGFICEIIAAIVLLFVVFIMFFKYNDMNKTQEKYIKIWRKVKLIEALK